VRLQVIDLPYDATTEWWPEGSRVLSWLSLPRLDELLPRSRHSQALNEA
jgi:hypothetical protein